MEISRFLAIPDIVSLTACLTWVRRKVVKASYISANREAKRQRRFLATSRFFALHWGVASSYMMIGIVLYDGGHHLIWWPTSPWQETRHATSLRLGEHVVAASRQYFWWFPVLLLLKVSSTALPVPAYWNSSTSKLVLERILYFWQHGAIYVTASLWLFVELML